MIPVASSRLLRARPQGMVLLLALLCLLALEVTAVGIHFVVLQELRTARAVGRTTQLRLAAQAAVSRALVTWPASALPLLQPLDSLSLPASVGFAPGGITFSATVERLAGDLFLVRGTAMSPLRETTSVGALVALAPAEWMAGVVPAAVTTTGMLELLPGGVVTANAGSPAGGAVDSTAGLSPDGCTAAVGSPGAAALVRTDASVVSSGGRLEGGILIGTPEHDVNADRVAHLTRTAVADFGLDIPAPVLTPLPLSIADECIEDRFDSWGEPADEVTACREYFPILHRSGDLTITRGRGQGIMVVDGSLTLDGARFDGVVMVRGQVFLRAGASVNGAILAEGDVRLDQSTVIFDRCAIADAFRDIRVRGPFRPVGRTWIPLF